MSVFQFKQFSLHHDRSSMRVGTDGVLLGAWAELPDGNNLAPTILDIGTGCGLIALMAAQRCPAAHVTGIDIDAASVDEARLNVTASPFAARVTILQTSLQELMAEPFAAIICNPPFFEETLLPPDMARAAARHTSTLPFPILARCASKLLTPDGTFSLVLPTSAFDDFIHTAFAEGLRLARRLDVRTSPHKTPKRTLATFRHAPYDSAPVTAIMNLTNGSARSDDYARLTRDFYVH